MVSYRLIPSSNIDEYRILESDLTSGTTGQTRLRVVDLDVISLDDYLHAKNQTYHLILSSNIANQRILLSDWIRDIIGHAHTKLMVCGTTKLVVCGSIFSWWLTPCKITKTLLILSRENEVKAWLEEMLHWPHPSLDQ